VGLAGTSGTTSSDGVLDSPGPGISVEPGIGAPFSVQAKRKNIPSNNVTDVKALFI
jgi:hypothetical protein